MFSLIVTIISIALVGVLAAAGIYYIGPTTLEARDRAAQARLINEGSQISGAAALYYNDKKEYAPDIETLMANNYLTANPNAQWGSFTDMAVVPDIPRERCDGLNAKAGITEIPLCSDPAIAGKTLCCQTE